MSARPDDWARAREIFEEALARPDTERLPHVTAACAGNDTLRDEVVRMLASHDRAAGFLSTPAADLLAPGTMPSLAGQQIGPYLLVLRIGAGGMPLEYQTEVPDTYSSARVWPPYHSVIVILVQTVLGSASMALSFGSALPFSLGRPF